MRQIQAFENGNGLKYWPEFTEDKYSDDFEQFKIDKIEFEKAWKIYYNK
jgi:hypothetical protein